MAVWNLSTDFPSEYSYLFFIHMYMYFKLPIGEKIKILYFLIGKQLKSEVKLLDLKIITMPINGQISMNYALNANKMWRWIMSKHKAHMKCFNTEWALQYKDYVNRCSYSESSSFTVTVILILFKPLFDLKICKKLLQHDTMEALRWVLIIYCKYIIFIYSDPISNSQWSQHGRKAGPGQFLSFYTKLAGCL